jgi:hypothetical protein
MVYGNSLIKYEKKLQQLRLIICIKIMIIYLYFIIYSFNFNFSNIFYNLIIRIIRSNLINL